MKRFAQFINSPKTLLICSFLLNLCLVLLGCFYIKHFVIYYFLFNIIFTFIISLIIYKKIDTKTQKNLTLINILMPLFGLCWTISYLQNNGDIKARKQWLDLIYYASSYFQQDISVLDSLKSKSLTSSKLSNYILNSNNLPIYQNSTSTYYDNCDDYIKNMFEQLRNAKKYIFIEFYKIDDGILWQELFDILRLKARDGIIVKLLYDDYGCRNSFKNNFKIFNKLENHNIETCAFNEIKPFKVFSRNRSRRNSIIIDGKICYISCVNFIDEATHSSNQYGSFKDCAIKYVGEACWNNTVMFLNSWKFSKKQEVSLDDYRPIYKNYEKTKEFIQPFSVNPTSNKLTTKFILLNTISSATTSLYISFPYLILDDELKGALVRSAKSGVDVKIVYPAIPLDKVKYYLARESFYELAKFGVKLYEHTTAHLHSKLIIIDNDSILFGNLNLCKENQPKCFDNGVYIHGASCINKINKDFDNILQESRQLSTKELKKRTLKEKLVCWFYRFFAI